MGFLKIWMYRPAIFLLLLLMASSREAAADDPPGDMVLIPAGEFLMGSDEGNADEAPAHRVYLDAYYIDRHEVTNAAFAQFVRASGSFDTVEGPWFRHSVEGCLDLIGHYENRYGVALGKFDWQSGNEAKERQARFHDATVWRAAVSALQTLLGKEQGPAEGERIAGFASQPAVRELIEKQARMPVREVTWRDAAAYARWVDKRLPTEAEWEKAARGADNRLYPWGDTWGPRRCRAGLDPDAGPVPVGEHPDGASPYGCLDMAGNVWEWVADWYGEDYYASLQSTVNPRGPVGLPDGRLPGTSTDVNLLRSTRQGRESDTRKVIRGGAWAGPELQARFNLRCTRRLWSNPSYWHPDVGFRCARDAK